MLVLIVKNIFLKVFSPFILVGDVKIFICLKDASFPDGLVTIQEQDFKIPFIYKAYIITSAIVF